MKKPKWNLRPLGETILASLLLVTVLVVFNELNGLLKPTTESFIAFGIILVSYLIFSGKVRRVSAGTFSLWMNEPVAPNRFHELSIGELVKMVGSAAGSVTVPKASSDFLVNSIVPRLYNQRITTLSLTKGESYRAFDLGKYLDYLRTSPYFRNIVFLDQEGRFEGLMNPEALRLLLEFAEGRKTIEEALREWNLSAIPGMIRSSVPETATNREALQKMLVENINVLPVVGFNMAFLGVVTRDEIVSRSIYSLIAGN